MKTQSKEIIEAVNQYYATKQQMKEMEKLLKEIKSVLEKKMGAETILEAGERTVILSEASRASLDRKALETKFGADLLKEFEKVTTYKKLEVK